MYLQNINEYEIIIRNEKFDYRAGVIFVINFNILGS